MKRTFDIVVATAAGLALMPVFLIVAVLVVTNLGSPILFRQTRPGMRGEPFEIIKFRTMLNPTDGMNNMLSDELRLTRFGRFLRSTSLDEIPGLWNVIRGDMSIVGPRPLLMDYLSLYSDEQFRRHDVRPGITGWAQVHGRNALSWDEKFQLDIWYVGNRTFLLDLVIILKTIKKVIFREGISAAGEATMPRFEGNRKSQKDASN